MSMRNRRPGLALILGLCSPLVIGMVASAKAEDAPAITPKTAPAGEAMTLIGAVIHRDGETFTMRLLDRSEYTVVLTDETTIKTERKGLFRGSKPFDITSIIDGLVCEVDGPGDELGRVVAKRIRFTEADLHAAITAQIHSRPIRETAQAAEESAAAAHERIGALDEWEERGVVSVHFAVGSAEISEEGRKALDDLAAKAPGATNYKVEITGHTDSTGDDPVNQELSEKRAEAVVRYLTVTHQIPLRRVNLPMGYGATQGTADNSTEEGRAHNRRVDVRVLVNKGVAQEAPAPRG